MKSFKHSILIIIICFLMIAGVSLVYAFVSPPGDPTFCPADYPGCDAPINVGSAQQDKAGNFRPDGLRVFYNAFLATDGGRVGIGTTNLKSNSKFEVNIGNNDDVFMVRTDPNIGLELRSGSFGGTPYIDFSNDASTDYDMRLILKDNNTFAMDSISGIGNLEIVNGSVLMGNGLTWLRNKEWSDSYVLQQSWTDGALPGGLGDYTRIGHGGSGAVVNYLDVSEAKGFIFNNGNVGIGTDNPLAKLNVVGNVRIDGNLSINSGGGTAQITIGDNAQAGRLTVYKSGIQSMGGPVKTLDNFGNPRLWGEGRPGVIVKTPTGDGTTGTIKYSWGKTLVNWYGVASGCPASTWVCTATERGNVDVGPNYCSWVVIVPGNPTWFCSTDESNEYGWVTDNLSMKKFNGELVSSKDGSARRLAWCCWE